MKNVTYTRRFIRFDHTADLGVYFYGADPTELFRHAGLALFALLLERPPRHGPAPRRVELTGMDMEDLFVRWLNELLYYFQVQEQVVAEIPSLRLDRDRLSADLAMTPYDRCAHGLRQEIKAATYHQVAIRPAKRGWRARVVFDV